MKKGLVPTTFQVLDGHLDGGVGAGGGGRFKLGPFFIFFLFEMLLFILNRFQTTQSVLPLYLVELLMYIVFNTGMIK